MTPAGARSSLRSATARACAALLVLVAAACRSPEPGNGAATTAPSAPAPTAPAPAPPFAGRFADATDAAGIRFVHVNGASGRKWLPETMGSGVAIFDADSDGLQDLFFVNSRRWPQDGPGPKSTSALYRNLGGLRFEDVSAKSGLDLELFGMGAVAADHDGDGDADLAVTALDGVRLLRNDAGRFTDATKAAGLADAGWATAATWLDADRDGDPDLVVGHYVTWTPETDLHCTLDGKNKSYCTPESYPGASPALWINRGDGTFEDATERSGLRVTHAKTLGLIAADLDDDGVLDIAAANDTQPNYLFRGRGDGTFEEQGVISGIAFGETGLVRAGMGMDVSDFDANGLPDLVIGNFSSEMIGLYRNERRGLFVDAAATTGAGQLTLLTLAFGCVFADLDLDGREDVFVANGHIEPDIEHVQAQVAFAEPPHLLRQLPDGRFDDVAAIAGAELVAPKVARGAAVGDLDGDGDLDLVLTQNGGAARLYRNDLPAGPAWLRVDARARGGRDAWGARVIVAAGGRKQAKIVRAGSSYLSQSERILSFGLGDATAVDGIEVRWPSGATSTHAAPSLRTTLVVEEP